MKGLFTLLVVLVLAAGCTSSKFDYQTAYKFSHNQYFKQQEQQLVLEQQQQQVFEYQPLASLKPVIATPSTLPSDKALLELATAHKTKVLTVEYYKTAPKEEKQAIRKQVKQEYKTLRKQFKEAKQVNEHAAQDFVFNKKMMIGAIILGAGILVAILASGPVGAVGIIVGIGLMAWGLIEQT